MCMVHCAWCIAQAEVVSGDEQPGQDGDGLRGAGKCEIVLYILQLSNMFSMTQTSC